MPSDLPVLALTQGDPAGVGPELLLNIAGGARAGWRPLLLAERAALEAAQRLQPDLPEPEFHYFEGPPSRDQLDELTANAVAVVDPLGEHRTPSPGEPGAADAEAALAALDLGIQLCQQGTADALVTCPVSKAVIARHCRPDFRGHTDYIAAACGLERYGRDYLMGFLAPSLQVALLSTHQPLAEALAELEARSIVDALSCLHRYAGGRIAVAGVNPHAGEGGLLGEEDARIVQPAVSRARAMLIDVRGPESPDSLFARARRGEFDWVLALYHDQGLIAVKTAYFGGATNWTIGLPFVRTSVDHGTAYELAGRGLADARPLRQVVETTLKLLSGELPKRTGTEA